MANSTQSLLEPLKTEFNIQAEETDMPFISAPDIPPQQAPLITVASAAQSSIKELYGTIGECTVVEKLNDSGYRKLYVRDVAWNIFSHKNPSLIGGMPETKVHPEKFTGDDKYFGAGDIDRATVQVLLPPKHGVLTKEFSPFQEIFYHPNAGYVGKDTAVFLVNMGGYNIKVDYYIEVVDVKKYGNPKVDGIHYKHCPVDEWVISNSGDTTYITATSTDSE